MCPRHIQGSGSRSRRIVPPGPCPSWPDVAESRHKVPQTQQRPLHSWRRPPRRSRRPTRRRARLRSLLRRGGTSRSRRPAVPSVEASLESGQVSSPTLDYCYQYRYSTCRSRRLSLEPGQVSTRLHCCQYRHGPVSPVCSLRRAPSRVTPRGPEEAPRRRRRPTRSRARPRSLLLPGAVHPAARSRSRRRLSLGDQNPARSRRAPTPSRRATPSRHASHHHHHHHRRRHRTLDLLLHETDI